MLRRHCRKLGAVCRLWSMTRAHPWPFGKERAGAEENGGKKRKPAQKNLFFGRAFLVRRVADVHRYHA